jgi:hypothetical protein
MLISSTGARSTLMSQPIVIPQHRPIRFCPKLTETGLVYTQPRPVSDQVIAYRQRRSHLSLLGHLQRVIHFDAEIAQGAFELRMT